MAQRYTDPKALQRMKDGRCPECGHLPDVHNRLASCSLTEHGVHERIMQYTLDQPTWPPA